MLTLYEGSIVGVTFEPAKSNLSNFFKLHQGGFLFNNVVIGLLPDKENKHDKSAIKVKLTTIHGDEFTTGFIPKTHNKLLLNHGLENLRTEIVRVNEDLDGNPIGLTIRVSRVAENEELFSV